MEIRRYVPLFKFRICTLITYSAIVGFIATNSGLHSLDRMLFLIIATMLAASSASIFNHYFDSDIDAEMTRTRKRPLPSRDIVSSRLVLVLALLLFGASLVVSFKALNYMVALHLALGAFVYTVIYTVWLKRRSWLNIIIGGLAGSFAVLAGGASAQPQLCLPPVLLAIVMFFWTPSHFWSFAILHREDYERAGIPMLPVLIGNTKTAFYILINTIALVFTSLIPFFMGYTGWIYFVSAVAVGVYFIVLNIQLIRNTTKDMAWRNFKSSMIYLGVLFTSVIVDRIV